jgi:Fe-S cluster biogenesis protein NfuA
MYTEETPNPLALKIVLGTPPVETGYHLFSSLDQVQGHRVLEDILSLPGVQEVLLAPDFVTVTKSEKVPWSLLESVLLSIFQHHLNQFPLNVDQLSVTLEASHHQWQDWVPETPEMEQLFKDVGVLIDEQVRPAIESDGGMIDLCGIRDGVVYVRLQGACSSCPHAEDTLKGGIQQALCHYFPEIKGVETVDG